MRQSIQELVTLYQGSLFAMAFNICKNIQDAEDVVQETLVQYITTKKEFESDQHVRAWLIRVAINKAKNINVNITLINLCYYRLYILKNKDRSLQNHIKILKYSYIHQ